MYATIPGMSNILERGELDKLVSETFDDSGARMTNEEALLYFAAIGDSQVDQFLGQRYATPLADAPAAIVHAANFLAVFAAKGRKNFRTAAGAQEYDGLVGPSGYLRDIATGKQRLPDRFKDLNFDDPRGAPENRIDAGAETPASEDIRRFT